MDEASFIVIWTYQGITLELHLEEPNILSLTGDDDMNSNIPSIGLYVVKAHIRPGMARARDPVFFQTALDAIYSAYRNDRISEVHTLTLDDHCDNIAIATSIATLNAPFMRGLWVPACAGYFDIMVMTLGGDGEMAH